MRQFDRQSAVLGLRDERVPRGVDAATGRSLLETMIVIASNDDLKPIRGGSVP